MQTNAKWLDNMQVRLSAVCKSQNWDLKQTSVLGGRYAILRGQAWQ